MLEIYSVWNIECRGKDGNLKWVEDVKNLVVAEGVDFFLDTVFNSTVAYTTDLYMGLKDDGVPATADTLASHPGWDELVGYTGDRKSTPFNAASSGSIDNSGIRPEFDITVADTIYGMFLCTVATGTAGTLLSAVDFASPRAVDIGDSFRVSVTYTLQGG